MDQYESGRDEILPSGFIYTKVDIKENNIVNYLLRNGFYIIEIYLLYCVWCFEFFIDYL